MDGRRRCKAAQIARQSSTRKRVLFLCYNVGMTRYTDEFRASAVLMLQAAGYPDKKGSLARVSKHLGVHARTLSRWARSESNPPPDKIVNKKEIDLVQAIKAELSGILGDMPDARQDADYRALATALGILVDKIQLLTGQPTERTETRILSDEERAKRLRAAYVGIDDSAIRPSA